MAADRPSSDSRRLPLYVRNVAYDQWIRLTIETTSTVATLKDKVLTRFRMDDVDSAPPAVQLPTRPRAKMKRNPSSSAKEEQRQPLSTAVLPSTPERCFIARAPGITQQTGLLLDSVTASRHAREILAGDPGRGGPGSLPRTQLAEGVYVVKRQLGCSPSGRSAGMDTPDGDLLASHCGERAGLSPVHELAATLPMQSTPVPSDSRCDSYEGLTDSEVEDGASFVSGTTDEELSLSPRPDSSIHRRSTTDPESDVSREGNDWPQPSQLVVADTEESFPTLRGNEDAKRREEQALKLLNEQLERSTLLSESPLLTASVSADSAEEQGHRLPKSMTANERRVQRLRRRAMEYLLTDDALWDSDDQYSSMTTSAGLLFSSGVRSIASPRSSGREGFGDPENLTHPLQRSLVSDSRSATMATRAASYKSEAIRAMSPTNSSDASCAQSEYDTSYCSSSHCQPSPLDTRNEDRLWGTQLEAARSRERQQEHKRPLETAHRRDRSATIKAPPTRPSTEDSSSTAALVASVSTPSLSKPDSKAASISRMAPNKPASVPSPPSLASRSQDTVFLSHRPTPAPLSFATCSSPVSSPDSTPVVSNPCQITTLMARLKKPRRSLQEPVREIVVSEAEEHPLATQCCLLSISKGMLLDNSASIASYRLRPFELLELQSQSARERVHLPRQAGKPSALHPGEILGRRGMSQFPPQCGLPSQSSPFAEWPLLDRDYLEPFAHGWVYIHQSGGCSEKAQRAGLASWKLRWFVLQDKKFVMYRDRPLRGQRRQDSGERASVGDRSEPDGQLHRVSFYEPIAVWKVDNVLWVDSERCDGATNPSVPNKADDLVNVSFKGVPPTRYGLLQDGPSHVISLRFLTNHQARCWYDVFQKAHYRVQLAKRNEVISAEELRKLPLALNNSRLQSSIDCQQLPESSAGRAGPIRINVDEWRHRAYFRSVVAGRGGILLPGESGRSGGVNALSRARLSSAGKGGSFEDGDQWSEHSEDEGAVVVNGAPVAAVTVEAGCRRNSNREAEEKTRKNEGRDTGLENGKASQSPQNSQESVVTQKVPAKAKVQAEPKTSSQRAHSRRGLMVQMHGNDWLPPVPAPPPSPARSTSSSPRRSQATRSKSYANMYAASASEEQVASSRGLSGTSSRNNALLSTDLAAMRSRKSFASFSLRPRTSISATLAAGEETTSERYEILIPSSERAEMSPTSSVLSLSTSSSAPAWAACPSTTEEQATRSDGASTIRSSVNAATGVSPVGSSRDTIYPLPSSSLTLNPRNPLAHSTSTSLSALLLRTSLQANSGEPLPIRARSSTTIIRPTTRPTTKAEQLSAAASRLDLARLQIPYAGVVPGGSRKQKAELLTPTPRSSSQIHSFGGGGGGGGGEGEGGVAASPRNIASSSSSIRSAITSDHAPTSPSATREEASDYAKRRSRGFSLSRLLSRRS